MEAPRSRRATPRPEVALAWGSQSMTRTRLPLSARMAAMLMTVVVLPTPPFWLATAMTRAGTVLDYGGGGGEPALPGVCEPPVRLPFRGIVAVIHGKHPTVKQLLV